MSLRAWFFALPLGALFWAVIVAAAVLAAR